MRRFQAGGTVREGATYVERKADREIVDALLEGEFCYVLAPRQIGKSSLRMRAQKELRARGVRCASVDLTSIGTSGLSDEEWYFGLVEEIAGQLDVGRDPAELWAKRQSLAPVHRFLHFLSGEILSQVPGPVVISIDEIDAVLALPFAGDDFFAAIRAAYNKRAEEPVFARLTFCIFGVATPAELIHDATRTPFNIGRGIRLEDFTRAEAEALLPGLDAAGGDARALLDAVLDWTSGHPYMTQRVCVALTEAPLEEGFAVKERVDALVDHLFLQRGRTEEPNLAYAEKRLQKTEPMLRTQMLRIYRRLLHGDEVAVKGDDPAELELRLAGLVSERIDEAGAARLLIRNRIFAQVFDLRWVDENDSTNPLSEPVASWLQWKRGDDFLLRGAALEVALAWAKGRDDLSPEEHEFLRMSSLLVEREKSTWQRRRLAVAVVVLLAAVVVLGTLILYKQKKLEAEKLSTETAESARKDAEQRLEQARADLDVRSKQALAAQQDAEKKAQEAINHAATLQVIADDLTREVEAARAKGKLEEALAKQADEANNEAKSARERAVQQREFAVVAQDVAAKAATAAKGYAGGSVAENTLQSEQAAREAAEHLLELEKASRVRAEKDLKTATEQLKACQKERDRLSRPKGSWATPP